MRLSVLFEDGIVADVRYKTRGCTASIAAGSVLTMWLEAKQRMTLAELTADMIDQALGGLPMESRHAAVLCVDAVKAILRAGERG